MGQPRLSPPLVLYHARAGRIGGMARDEEKQGGVGAATFCTLAALVFLPVFYLLSSGPASALLSEDTWGAVYFPLRLIFFFLPPFGRAFDWYVKLWV
jgi:hypothetical protein